MWYFSPKKVLHSFLCAAKWANKKKYNSKKKIEKMLFDTKLSVSPSSLCLHVKVLKYSLNSFPLELKIQLWNEYKGNMWNFSKISNFSSPKAMRETF